MKVAVTILFDQNVQGERNSMTRLCYIRTKREKTLKVDQISNSATMNFIHFLATSLYQWYREFNSVEKFQNRFAIHSKRIQGKSASADHGTTRT